MTISEYKDKLKDTPIQKPNNVSDGQWEKAVNLYHVAKDRGDKYPELTVAQAVLETGWFKSPAGKFNYFGQKASKNQAGTTRSTKEVENNKSYNTESKFRDYSSLTEAVDDRIKKWSSKYEDAKNIDEAIGSIWQYDAKTGKGKGYATDDKYDVKLKTILGMMGVDTKTAESRNTSIKQETQPLPTTTVTNLPITEEKPNFVAETPNITEQEKAFLEEYVKTQPKQVQPLPYLAVEDQPIVQQAPQENYQIPTTNIIELFDKVSQFVDSPVAFQQGGKLGEADNLKYKNVKNFYYNYIQSDEYLNKLKNQGYENPEDIVKKRLNSLLNTKVEEVPSYISTAKEKNIITLGKQDLEFFNPRSLLAHEFSHKLGAGSNSGFYNGNEAWGEDFKINNNDVRVLNESNNLLSSKGMYDRTEEESHDSSPNEFKADIDAFRYMLYENKIYNSKSPIEQKDLKNLPSNIKNDELYKRLRKKVKDDKSLIYLMNTLANNVQQNTNISYSQQGGKITKNEIEFLSEIAIKDNNGYWNPNNKGKVVEISSPNISMKNLDYSVLGISKETGEKKVMQTGQEYFFKNTKKVIEIPLKK
jgi:Mannosyl-glycoprotein endo-beta-N-acetylglucosaminidase